MSTDMQKPFAFVGLPDKFETAPPVWHDGSGNDGRLSGEIRFEMENLTPLLVGWERSTIQNEMEDGDWQNPADAVPEREAREFVSKSQSKWGPEDVVRLPDGRITIRSKAVLCPLRAPWGERPVIIPGDSLKGLLRHELGALLGAPMERVAERSYSYRPNSLFPKDPNPKLKPRLALIPEGGVESINLDGQNLRVPIRLELLPDNLQYHNSRRTVGPPRYQFDPAGRGGRPYRGGMGAGESLNSKKDLHRFLEATPDTPRTLVDVPDAVQNGYLNTLKHLIDLKAGHFSERHPDVPKIIGGDATRIRILRQAAEIVMSPGDLVWVEWDTDAQAIVSLGWHYYYRWAYQDTVQLRDWRNEREGLFPLPEEKGDVPQRLSPVRRLFGYAELDKVGSGQHSQMMGRISINAALECVSVTEDENARFLPPTFLKELGMPRPSAVEYYLKQRYYPRTRPSDQAKLETYGDAKGYDTPGQLAGRKFYLDRSAELVKEPWRDDSESNRANERSTLAVDASKVNRRFRFTLRFRDLDAAELAAVLLAFCPHQLRNMVGATYSDGYCSKLGYARPLGWGTVRIVAKELHFLRPGSGTVLLERQDNLEQWFQQNFKQPACLVEWLKVHRFKNPESGDYRRENGEIITFHSQLRANHSRLRRYRR